MSKTLNLEDFKANTKEWFLEQLGNMSAPQALQTISNLYDELHKPTYSKTYEDCCKILGIDVSRKFTYEEMPFYENCSFYENDILKMLEVLRKLIICRDAYWQIAGEELGLDKSWEPKNELSTRNKIYNIQTYCNKIEKGCTEYPTNRLLSFPTEEMRDIFYENFKDLIENCKELL